MAVSINIPDTDRMNTWLIDDLYFGTVLDEDKKLWRPNEDDMVIDWDVGQYRVVSVDDDNIPTLELIVRFDDVSQYDSDSTSLITALSLYGPSIAQRLYVNTDVDPYECVVDNAFQVYDSSAVKMKFFLGTDVTEDSGTVISEVYNSDGDLTSDYVTLTELTDTSSIKVPDGFYTTNSGVASGEIVTGVAYDSDGNIFREQVFLVTETSAIMPVDSTSVYITAVTLSGSLVSSDEDYTLVNTSGDTIDTSGLKGVLHYSDGSTTTVAIDGTQMVLYGVDNFDTTYIGNPTSLTLVYYPSDGEAYINGGEDASTPSISQIYTITNVADDTAYELKVFIIPAWDDDNSEYTFTYWLVNDDGDLFVDVTDLVVVEQSDGSDLSSTDFSTTQTVNLTLDMDEVSPTAYSGYTHTQTFGLTLENPEAASGQYWIIDYTNDELNVYGTDTYASINSDGNEISFSDAFGIDDTQQSDWLKLLYYSLDPIYDNDTLDEAPTPTGFRWRYGDTVSDIIDIDDWYDTITTTDVTFTEGDTVTLEFILTTDDGDFVKACAPMYLYEALS